MNTASSTKGKENMSTLVLEVRPHSEPLGQEHTSPTKVTADPDDGTVWEASRSTRDQDIENSTNHSGTSLNWNAFRENMINSDMESAFGDCVTCSDTDKVTITTTHKKYRKRE